MVENAGNNANKGENKGKPGHGKRILLRTFGCQMNARDSEFIAGLFLEKGYKLADSPDNADIVVFNTCSVREHAEQRAISNMGHLMHRYKDKKIYGMVGCTAQALREKLFKRLPQLNLICGTGEIARLSELVEKAKKNRVTALDKINEPLPELNPPYRELKTHAYVSIMRGCNNFCSYCIVPYVRGRERSRDVKDIRDEIKALVERGIKDITLLGQNVNSYNGACNDKECETCSFVQLLRIVNDTSGIEKIRFMTSHPKDANIDLFKAMRGLDKIVKHLHLPLQSGSERILHLMERGYTSMRYLNFIGRAREIIPNLRLTTDIIVGFPTETEKDFKDTLNLMKRIGFDLAYIFKYSPRSGTKAAGMDGAVPEDIKRKRHKILLDLQKDISKKKNGKSI